MSADQLRRAAAKLRETSRPIAHLSPPWYSTPGDDGRWLVGYDTSHPDAGLIATTPDYGGMDLADWIALMHPGLAVSLAALLEELADQSNGPPCDGPFGVCNNCQSRPDFFFADELACAILRETNRP